MGKKLLAWFAAGLCLLTVFAGSRIALAQESAAIVGIFEGHGDIGTVLHVGTSEYDSSKRSYALTGSGENMWSDSDNFQFAWKKWSGDASLTADISFVGQGGNAHRKAVLMMRQSLEPDSAYVDVATAWLLYSIARLKGRLRMRFSRIFLRLLNCVSKSAVITFPCGWGGVAKKYNLLEPRCVFPLARLFM